MDEDIQMYINADSVSYLESLMKSRYYLKDSGKILSQLDEVIEAELELALIGAKKDKSELLKNSKDNVVRPIK